MSYEVAKYDNKLNLLDFKNMSKIENNLFFASLAKIREHGTAEVKFYMSDILTFTEKNLTMDEAIKLTFSAMKKVVKSSLKWQIDEHRTRLFNLFEYFEISDLDGEITCKITETFKDILNHFKDGQFTMFEVAEFSELSSKYSQTIYRLCKQFRSQGYLIMKWQDFKDRLDIPKSYNVGTIDTQILNKVLIDFNEPTLFNPNKPIFKNFKFNKIRGKGKGRPITHIEFTFAPENTDNKKMTAEKKELENLRAKNETINFSNKYSGNQIQEANGEIWLIMEVKKNSNDEIHTLCQNVKNYNTRKNFIFKSVENLQNAIDTYKAKNPIKDRPEIRNIFGGNN